MAGMSAQVWQAVLEARRVCAWYVASRVYEAEDAWDMLANYTENQVMLRWMDTATKEEYQEFLRVWGA